jgi:glycosyltransferase involved in cell wall biosynthesis
MERTPLTVAWLSYFPVEWLSGTPEEVMKLPRQHPTTWQRVLLAELEKMPFLRLHVLALRKDFERSRAFERNGVVFHLIKTIRGMRAPTLFWHDTCLIKRVLRDVKPDLLHAWGTESGAALVASRLGYPYLVTIQGLASSCAESYPLNLYERLAALLEPISLARAPVITAESRFAVEYVRHRLSGGGIRQIEVAPDPLFHGIERHPQLNPRRILFVAELGYRKGGDVLLSALDRLRDEIDLELIVVGRPDPKFLKKARTRISPAVWKLIRFKENLSSSEIACELATAAMVVFPTRADTGPMAVKEAVVAGVPVIGSTVGGIPDYIIPGQNGFLFTSGDVNGCIEAIRRVCEHPVLGRGLVTPGSLAEKRAYLSAELMAKKFAAAYSFAKEHGPAPELSLSTDAGRNTGCSAEKVCGRTLS